MKKLFFLLIILSTFYLSSNGQTVGTGQLKVSFNDTNNGVTVSSILDGNTEILQTADDIFTLLIRNTNNDVETAIASSANWGTTNVTLSNGNSNCTITLSNPTTGGLPSSLVATVTLNVQGLTSEWDLSVTGLGANHSLMETDFPNLIIKGVNGQFLIPRYSGQLIANPASGINYTGHYPRGNATNMQFMAYYLANSGVYFGFHDPTAASKIFEVNNESGGVKVVCSQLIPNQTIAANDWSFPGHFALDLFNGDWYEASMIYKDWASATASYWPHLTPAREARQAELGKIGVWFNDIGYYNGNARTAASIQNGTQNCIDYIPNVPIATHLYTWNGRPNDDDYPEVFPAIDGLDDAIATLESNGAFVMPYFNGRLYDTDLASFNGVGLPDATKRENGDYYAQNFNNSDGVSIHFAVMCPSRPNWQGIVTDAADQLANGQNAQGVYLDQVSAASGLPCMDDTHGHTLGGGTFWRDGYRDMINGVHSVIPADGFVTVEGACDYLLDEVDGVLVDPWDKENMVPAYPAVYSGRVQMFGTSTGTNTYNNASFYTQLGQTFSFGVQPGRFTTYLINDPNSQATAKPFVRKLAVMRFKLHEHMSFGEMKYPPTVTAINPNPIPTITSNWGTNNNPRNVTISALQSSIWQNEEGIAVVFVNTSMAGADLNFSFDVNGLDYGMNGDLLVQEVTETTDGPFATVNNSFTETVTLAPMDIKAYIIKSVNGPLAVTMVSPFTGYKINNKVALKWKTAAEENFLGFGIERSYDGIHWKNIGFTPGKGNAFTGYAYQFLDSTPNTGINYYRLKETDIDGHFEYSNVISVEFQRSEISIYPNPTGGQVFIKSKDIAIDRIMVYNAFGQLSYWTDTSKNVLDISHLPKGVYTVTVQSKSDLFSKLIVLE